MISNHSQTRSARSGQNYKLQTKREIERRKFLWIKDRDFVILSSFYDQHVFMLLWSTWKCKNFEEEKKEERVRKSTSSDPFLIHIFIIIYCTCIHLAGASILKWGKVQTLLYKGANNICIKLKYHHLKADM